MKILPEEIYMQRCIQLALLGAGRVAPNPMVGAVLVYEDTIIGEGYHSEYGHAHAEVNCINSVREENKTKIKKSTLYVSLEPCAHFGKTPPCVDLIIELNIPKVVIGCTDIFSEVSGRGIQKLTDEKVEVLTGVLEKECIDLNKRFFTFHLKKRPYIILKWAQSANNKIGTFKERILISNDYSNRLVHKIRCEEASILIGTKTAIMDNPSLTNRFWNGKSPVRIIIDATLKLDNSLKIFNTDSPTIVFNTIKNERRENVQYFKIEKAHFLVGLLQTLYTLNINSLLVEGGAYTLQSFITAGLWDEAIVITNENIIIEEGTAAPLLKNATLTRHKSYFNDNWHYYSNANNRATKM